MSKVKLRKMRLFSRPKPAGMSLPDEITLAGQPPITIKLCPNVRARRLVLRVARVSGEIRMSIPPNVCLDEIYAFGQEKEEWIGRASARIVPSRRVSYGAYFPFEGQLCELFPGLGRGGVSYDSGRLLIDGGEAVMAARLKAFLKAHAQARLLASSEKYAAMIGRAFSTLVLRDPSSRWGSCTDSGRLMYSWRLIMAPPEVLDYVAAHEIAHLRHMNHSRRYWECVSELCPEYKRLRCWLSDTGAELQSWVF